MSKIHILCVEDEPEVLEAVVRDLSPFEEVFPIEATSSADEARRVLQKVILPQGELGLAICDHILPGEDGVSLMVSLHQADRTRAARKVLLTAQAGLQATIEAVNRAELSHYLAKPWSRDELVEVTRRLLTDYVLETQTNLYPYLGVLEADRLTERIRATPLPTDDSHAPSITPAPPASPRTFVYLRGRTYNRADRMAEPNTAEPKTMGRVLCEHCTAACCRYIAVPIDTPKNKRDFDDMRWYVIHENIAVFVEDGDWYIQIHNPCRNIHWYRIFDNIPDCILIF